MKPVAGRTHHLALSKGAPGSETLQGLMLPDLKSYQESPYAPFAPTAGEGEATNRDTNVTATWEKQQDFSGGVGKLIERKTEDNGYAYSFANTAANGKVGATLFSGQAGCLMPPAAWTAAGTINNAKQFCEFKGSQSTAGYYFVTSDATRKLYKYDSDGDSPSEVTLPTAGDLGGAASQLYTDGTTLYITQGASKNVISSTDGTTWAAYQVGSPLANVNADFLCGRDDGALAYIAGATLTPGTGVTGSPAYQATTIGASGTTATGMVFYKGALWIGKPEGLFSWYQGKVDKRFDAMEHQSTSNFTKMCVHHDLLYFNVKNHLYYTDGDRYVEIFPNDANGFANIQSIFPTSGPLLVGAKLQTQAQGQTLYYFPAAGADDNSVGTATWLTPEKASTESGATPNPSDNLYATADLSAVSSTRPVGAVTLAGNAGTFTWTNKDNILSSNNQYASSSVAGYGSTDELQCRTFGFAIPTDATIRGVAISVEANASNTVNARLDLTCALVKGGTKCGTFSGGFPESFPDTVTTFPTTATAYLWETTLTPADVNAANFGVNVWVERPDSSAGSATFNIDYVAMTVYYTPQSHYLKLTDFGVALPTNAVPTGIVVDIESEWGYSGSFTGKLVKGGVIGGDAKSFIPMMYLGGTPTVGTERHCYSYTFSSLWGNNLTRDDVTASTFGVAIAASGLDGTVRIDAVKMTVFYTTIDADREQLFMFWGPDAPGLNPIWSDADGTKPVLAMGATSLFDSTGERIYFCCNEAVNAHKIKYFPMTPRYVPASFLINTVWNYASFVELTEFSAGFRTVPKWWYEVVLNVRDPIATTYAKVDYCIDNGPWQECVDEHGVPARLSLSDRAVGCYFPFDTTGLYISLRIHMYTSSSTQVAKITHVTLRGLTKPKPRMQFSFPVNCGEKVKPLIGEDESGEVIHDFIYSAARQGYPCKLQDPWGDWHLVAFREPGPLRTIKEFKPPERDAPLRVFTIVTCVLMEVDPLTSDGDSQTWEAG